MTDMVPGSMEPSKSFKMILSRLGHYFINVMAPGSQYDTKASTCLNATVALDPGERSPWAAYDVDGRVRYIGSGVMDAKIFYLLYCVDRIRAKMARTAAKGKRRRLRHAHLWKHKKVRNLVDNVHRQVIAWLTQSYAVILLPKFETSQMVKRSGRRLNKKTTRELLKWRHYVFRQRLLQKAELVRGCTVAICDEPYTPKTCGACGNIHKKLSGCPHPRQRPERPQGDTAGPIVHS